MHILNTVKQLFMLTPVVMQFQLEKVYYKENKTFEGTFLLQAKKGIEISSVTIEFLQVIQISARESESNTLASVISRKPTALDPLQKYELPFSLKVKIPPETKREKKTYKGDLAPLNKATDKAKKQFYTYYVVATVKEKGKKDPLVYREKIRME